MIQITFRTVLTLISRALPTHLVSRCNELRRDTDKVMRLVKSLETTVEVNRPRNARTSAEGAQVSLKELPNA